MMYIRLKHLLTADQSLFQKVLHVFILFSIAVAYPLLQLLTLSSAFFVAGKNEPADLIFLTSALCFLIPTVLILPVWLLGHRSRSGRVAHGIILFVLISAIFLPALKRIVDWPAAWMLPITFFVAISFTVLYFRFETARSSLTFLFPVVLIVPVLFLFNPRVSRIVWAKQQQTAPVSVNSKNPVIMIVFDEFPLQSLLDLNGNINAHRFPNFSEFSRRATWYRNATTVSNATMQAMPAILTGKYPEHSLLPIRTDYPRNLFSLFNDAYELKVSEPATNLSPKVGRKHQPRFVQRNLLLFSDLSAIYLHHLLPRDLASRLPAVTQTWGGFWRQHPQISQLNRSRGLDQRAKVFRRFVTSIKRSRQPTLYFLHIMLPHVPWQYFPSGKQYNGKGIGHFGVDGVRTKSHKWVNDPAIIQLALKRYLLQVEFVDRLLGELMQHLEEKKLFDRALIVILADHGTTFHEGLTGRDITDQNLDEIVRIPLFIKKPFQKTGNTTDVNAQTIDVLPTILQILQIDCDWRLDGRSLLDPSIDSKMKMVYFGNRRREFPAQTDFLSGLKAIDSAIIDRAFPHPEWIGKNIGDFHFAGTAPIEVRLHNTDAFSNIDLGSGFLPALVTAQVKAQIPVSNLIFGIVVNGILRATVRPFQVGEQNQFISSVLAESSFQSGFNDVEIVLLSTNGKNEFLKPNLIREKGPPVVD